MSDTDREFGNVWSKFDQFEAPVPEELWEAVASGIGAPVEERSNRKWLWLLMLILGSGIGFGSLYFADPNVVAAPTSVSKVKEIPETPEKPPQFKAEKVAITSEAESAQEMVPEENPEMLDLPVNGHIQQAKRERLEDNQTDVRFKGNYSQLPQVFDDSIAVLARNENTIDLPGIRPNVLSEIEKMDRPMFMLKSLGLPEIEFTSFPSFDKGGFSMPKATRWLTRLNFGFQMNYSTINPNPNDDLFVASKSYDFDLDTDRLGLTIGYDMWFYLNRRVWLKTQVFSHFRRFNIRFNYEESGDGDPIEFKDQLNTLSFGAAVGLIYQLDQDVSKSSLDVLLSYENALINDFRNTDLLSYPSGLWNVNLGYSFSPSTRGMTRWMIRPYIFYGLNRNFGDRAGEVRPYGFGLQFIRHR